MPIFFSLVLLLFWGCHPHKNRKETIATAIGSLSTCFPHWNFYYGFKDTLALEILQLKANQQMSAPSPTHSLKLCWLPYLPTYGFQPFSAKRKTLSQRAHIHLYITVLQKSSRQGANYSSSTPYSHRCYSHPSLSLYVVHFVWDKASSFLNNMLTTKQNVTLIYFLQTTSLLHITTVFKTRVLNEHFAIIFRSFLMPQWNIF